MLKTTESRLISPKNISTYYHDEIIDEQKAEEIIYAERAKKSGIVPLVVEEVESGKYILVEKFEYYSSLRKIQPHKRVQCLVVPSTSEKKRLIHILKITIPLEKGTSWLFKNEHIMLLKQKYKLTEEQIALQTNCTTKRLKIMY